MAAALLASPPALAQEQTLAFDIERQSLSAALLEFGRQARMSIIAPSSLLEGKQGQPVRGELTARAAIQQLLAGSGLSFEFVRADAVRVYRSDQAGLDRNPASAGRIGRDRVVVTGTNIRGLLPESSPVEIYTADDIAETGATTLEQFIAKLPQNMGTRTQYGQQGNRDGVASVDLRGLGLGTTLVLLNGRRLAMSDRGQAADISLIPASAIERVEVLSDGASAIYGSDAVGGVINFVLRDDFEGAETSLSYGGVSDGGARQGGLTQTVGARWRGGNGLLSYDYFDASALDTDERAYAAMAGPGTLTPHSLRHALLGTVSQRLSDRLELSADVALARRIIKNEFSTLASNPLNTVKTDYSNRTTQYFTNLALAYDLSEASTASITASYSKIDSDGRGAGQFINSSAPPVLFEQNGDHSGLDLTAKIDGSLFELPAGDVRYSLGAGAMDERYVGTSAFGADSGRELGRRTSYVFGEVFIPIVGEDQAVPFLSRLELSAAARFTDYEDTSEPALDRDFGDDVSPKVGVLWGVSPSLRLRGSYGESFRAPALSQLDPSSARSQLAGGVPIPLAGGPPSTVLFLLESPASDLGPETAETSTFGIDFQPSARPGFQLNATYYSIDYTDRIASASFVGSPFADPAQVPDLLYRPSSAAFIEEALRTNPTVLNTTGISLADPASAAALLAANPNFWILDLRFRNLALSSQDGIDFAISDTFATPAGDVRLGAQATRVLSYRQQNSGNAPVIEIADTVRHPVDLRGRVFAGLSRDGFNGMLSVNYVDDYANPSAVTGAQDVGSWTTVDLAASYTFDGDAAAYGLEGVKLSLSIQNLFNEDPPFVAAGASDALVEPVGFDVWNANPLGRFISLGLSKTW